MCGDGCWGVSGGMSVGGVEAGGGGEWDAVGGGDECVRVEGEWGCVCGGGVSVGWVGEGGDGGVDVCVWGGGG